MKTRLSGAWTRSLAVVAIVAAAGFAMTARAVDPIPDHKTLVFPTMLPKAGHGATAPAGSEAGLIRNAYDGYYENFWKQTSYHEYDRTTGVKRTGFYVDTKTYGYVQLPWPITTRVGPLYTFPVFRPGPAPAKPRLIGEAFTDGVRLYSDNLIYSKTNGAASDGQWTPGESFEDVNGNGQWDAAVPGSSTSTTNIILAVTAEDFWNSSNTNKVISATNPWWVAGLRDTTSNNWNGTRGESFADYNGNIDLTNGVVGADTSIELWIYSPTLQYNVRIVGSEQDLNPTPAGFDGRLEGDFAHTYVNNGSPGGQANVPTNGVFDYTVDFGFFPPIIQVQRATWPVNVPAFVAIQRAYVRETGEFYTNSVPLNPTLHEVRTVQVPIYQAGELYSYNLGDHQFGDLPFDPASDGTWSPGNPASTNVTTVVVPPVPAEPWEDFISWFATDWVAGSNGWTCVPAYSNALTGATVRPGRNVPLTVAEYQAYIRWNYQGNTTDLVARAGNGLYDGPEKWTDLVDAKVWQPTNEVGALAWEAAPDGLPLIALAPGEQSPTCGGANPHWGPTVYATWTDWWTAAYGGTAPTNWPYGIPALEVFDPNDGAAGANPGANWIPQGAWGYDGDREWCDLPSSMYHLGLGRGLPYDKRGILRPADSDGSGNVSPCGDGLLGEVTSPWSGENFGEDIGADNPVKRVGPDHIIPCAGPYACNIEGIHGNDAGNLLTFELLTRVTESNLVSGVHPRQFRDHNLDGLIDSGESRGGEANYSNDANALTPESEGDDTGAIATEYPFNRTRYMEDAIECWDHSEDFSQLNRSATGSEIAPPLYGYPIYPPTVGAGGGNMGGTAGAFTFFPCRDTNTEIKIMFQVRPTEGGNLEGDVPSDVAGASFAMPILCHEQGHDLLGWPDLYDYDVGPGGGPLAIINYPIGGYDLMAGGGLVHGIPDMKSAAGWIAPQDLGTILPLNTPVTLSLYSSDKFRNNYFKFANPARDGEYFYFWYTLNSGAYGVVGGPGVYVSHTDVGDDPNAVPRQQRVNNHFTWEVVQADGLDQLQDGVNSGDTGDPFPGTSGLLSFSADTDPQARWWNQTDAGIRILNITLPTRAGDPALVTFQRFDTSAVWDYPTIGGMDTDLDGLADVWEYHYFGDLTTADGTTDSDYDGLRDFAEFLAHTDPTVTVGSADADGDKDSDGISNFDEVEVLGTNPIDPDTDDDGIADGDEIDPSVLAGKQGRQFTSPTDSRSPLLQRSAVLDGTAIVLPAVAPGDTGDRFAVPSWTVEAWVNLASGAETGTLIARTADNGRTNFCLRVDNNQVRLLFQTAGGATVTAGGAEYTIPAATWTHLAGVWDATRNTLELFVNGTSMRAQTSLVAPYRGEGLGTTIIGGGVRGYLDEVRIWSQAQTAGQIALNRDWFGPGRDFVVSGGGGLADIVFLVDATGSMGGPIDTVKSNMTAFALALDARGIDYTLGGVVYRDSLNAGDPPPAASGLWSTPAEFITWADGLAASGGGDGPEDGLGAIDLALDPASFTPTYRSGAQRVFVLITDTDVKNTEDPGDGGAVLSMAAVIADLKAAGVVVHVVTSPGADSEELATGTGGLTFDISSDTYEAVFDTIAAGITVTAVSGVGDLVAWYPFDDGGNTTPYGAEDYNHRLNWDYALSGVTFSTNAVDLRGHVDDDTDGIPDWWENLMLGTMKPVTNALDGTVTFLRIGDGAVTNDLDADGLNDLFEYYSDTNPLDRDTDNDGVLDQDEDRDLDGLSNRGEALLGSDPTLPDTDDDGLPDGYEVAHLWDPADSLSPMFHRVLQLGGTTNDYVEMPNEMRLALTNWSVEAWVRPTNGWAGGGTILSRQIEPGVMNWSLGIDGDLKPVAGIGTVTLTGTVAVANDGATWTHVAATMDYTNHLLRVYVNGVERGRKWMAALPRVNGVGPVTQRVGESFAGQIDEVRVWRNVQAQNVLAAFSHGALTGSETDLVAYYRFDDSSSYHAAAGKGTSDNASWRRGQVEDFSIAQRPGWMTGWRNAGTLRGSAAVTLLSDSENFLLLDSDSDGMPDSWELSNGLDPQAVDAQGDEDGDGVNNLNEYLGGTNPNSPDSDQNGVSDYNEDPDQDDLTTGEEQNLYGTNPGDPDTDDDTFSDGDEVNWSIPCAGRRITDPLYSRSPLVPRSLVLDGTAIDVRGPMQVGQPDRFDLAEWTVEMWYSPTNGAQTGNLVVRETDNGRTNLAVRLDAGVPTVLFQTEGGVTYRVSATAPMTPGEWTHLAGVWNPTNYTLALYVNGDGFKAQAAHAACAKGAGSLRIGDGVAGLLDQLMIWGVSRTHADVLSDMTDFGAPLRGGTSGSIVEADGILFFDGTNSFADAVVSYVQGDAGVAGNTHDDPDAALDGPDFDAAGSNTAGVVSLGVSDMVHVDVGLPSLVASFSNGFVQLELQDVYARANGDARPDLYIFEAASKQEPTYVFISEDGDNWEYVGLARGGTTGLDIDTAPLNPLQVYPPNITHAGFWGVLPPFGDRTFTYWFEEQPPLAVPVPNKKTYRYVWLVDNGFNLDTGLASIGMPGADIDAVGVKTYLSGDIVAWYPFDDGGRSAEDYSHMLDWDYALPGVTFASGSAPIQDELDNDTDGIADWWENQFFAGDADPNADEDGDGLTEFWEYWLDTTPLAGDSDGDGVTDGDEDYDNDGLSNLDEISIYKSDPRNSDTDDDGYLDGDEVNAAVPCPSPDGRTITSPVASRSPIVQRGMLLDGGAGVVVPARLVTNGVDRFDLRTWTLECWVMPTNGLQTGSLITRVTDSAQTNFALRLTANRPTVEFTTGAGHRYFAGNNVAIPSDTWTHLAGVWDAANKSLTLYVNGIAFQSAICLEDCAQGGGVTRIGAGVQGVIDEVRVWSAPRTAADIERWEPRVLSNFAEVTTEITQEQTQGDSAVAIMGEGGYDLIEDRLDEVGVPYDFVPTASLLNDAMFSQYTAIFFPCLVGGPSGDPAVQARIRNFVENGGRVYVACYSQPYFMGAFPGAAQLISGGGYSAVARIEDPEAEAYVGQPTMDIPTAWNCITSRDAGLTEPILVNNAQPTDDICFRYKLGEGEAFYTEFHSNGNTDGSQARFLQWLALEVASGGSSTNITTRTEIRSFNNLVAYYIFDDGGQTAEDYTHRLDDAYTLRNVQFSEGCVDLIGDFDDDVDGIPTWWEDMFFPGTTTNFVVSTNGVTNAVVISGASAAADLDRDGLSNLAEYYADTNPYAPDSDNDGKVDGLEDSDNDGMANVDEADAGSDLWLTDTDDDGVSDGAESLLGTSPTDALEALFDRVLDLDGAPGSYVELPIQSRFALSTWALETWMRADSLSGPVSLIEREVAANVENYMLGLDASQRPVVRFTAGDGSVVSATAPAAYAVPAGLWTHLAAAFDDHTGELQLFVNGWMVAGVVTDKHPRAEGMGPVWTRVGQGLDGQMDDVKIWSMMPFGAGPVVASGALAPTAGANGTPGDTVELAAGFYTLQYVSGEWLDATGARFSTVAVGAAADPATAVALASETGQASFSWPGGPATVFIPAVDASGNTGAGIQYTINEAVAGGSRPYESLKKVQQPAAGLVSYLRFDDGTNPTGTSGEAGWTWGQVQDFGWSDAQPWQSKWRWAATLNGAAAVLAAPADAPVQASLEDTDADGMPDWWEKLYFDADGLATNDVDGDGLSNLSEYFASLNPLRADTDLDGTTDYREDSDGDGIENGREQDVYGSNPGLIDTDDDGLGDLAEVQDETNPADSRSPAMEKALVFGGTTNDFVDLPADPQLSLADWTVEAWVYPTAARTSTVIRRTVWTDRDNYVLGIGPGMLPFVSFNTLSGGAPATARVAATNTVWTIPLNRWTHLAGRYDHASGRLVLYVNGDEVDDLVTPLEPWLDWSGPSLQRVGEGFAGRIDDVRIFDTSRSPARIAGVSSAAVINPVQPPWDFAVPAVATNPALVAYYRFDDGTWSPTAVSGRAGWTSGHAENFVEAYRNNWPLRWRNAATLRGNVTFMTLAGPGTLPGAAQTPIDGDSDGDGMPDWWEDAYGLDRLTNDAAGDADGDGLSNLYEYLSGTDPMDPETYGPGRPDADEDLDGDGLSNADEMAAGTFADVQDTDDDGLSDWEEITGETDASFARPAGSRAPRGVSDPLLSLDPPHPRSVYLDGSARLVVPPTDAVMGREWTLEAWVRPAADSAGGVILRRYVADPFNGGDGVNYELGLSPAGAGLLRPYILYRAKAGSEVRLDGTGATDVVLRDEAAYLTIPVGEWSHIAAVLHDGDHLLELYIDGYRVAYRNDATDRAPTLFSSVSGIRGDEVTIGAARSTGAVTQGFRGHIDEVIIRNEALDESQMAYAASAVASTAMPSAATRSPDVSQVLPAPTGVLQSPHVPDELLVRFKPNLTKPERHAVIESLGALDESVVAEDWGLHKVGVNAGQSLTNLLVSFQAHDLVQYAQPNYVYTVSTNTPNDPRYGELWGMEKITAPLAWDRATGGDVVVAVIDTGVDYNHEDLAANMWTNPGETPGNGLDDDANGFVDDVYGYDFVNGDGDPMDDNSHGTHCAGTIGGVGDNRIGVAGVNWKVKIMALKFLSGAGGGTTADAIAAIRYSTRMGAKLTSNSWGGGGFDQGMYDAISEANRGRILFVAAAGNNGSDNDALPFYPASFDLDNIISVAATDVGDGLAGFSCYGATTVDLGAPGVDILSCVPGNAYGLKSGTSMAAPHVSGAMALLYSAQPDLDYAAAKQRLLDTVDRIASLTGRCISEGRLNLDALIPAGGGGGPVPPRAGAGAYFSMDDGGVTAEDFAGTNDWETGWFHAARLQGAVWSDEVWDLNLDTDSDGIPNWWEAAYGLDVFSAADGRQDPDGDGLNNLNEYLSGNNPFAGDSDLNGTNDYEQDDDGDTLANGAEQDLYGTNPGLLDTDDDGYSDGDELRWQVHTPAPDGRTLTSPVYSRSPEIQRSLVCDGTAVVLPGRTGLEREDRFNMTNWTVECWVRPEGIQTGDIVVRTTGDGQKTFGLSLDNNKPVLEFTTVTGNRVVVGDALGRAIATNTWTHLAGTWDPATDSLKLYVNGLFVQSQACMEECVLGRGTVRVGDGFVGHIDELRIWDAVRSAGQVADALNLFSATNVKRQDASDDLVVDGITFTDGAKAFADIVGQLELGTAGPDGNNFVDPAAALGVPDCVPGTTNVGGFVSLGISDVWVDPPWYTGRPYDVVSFNFGWLRLEFNDVLLKASGDTRPDLYIYETGSLPEGCYVFISQEGDTWEYAGRTTGGTTGLDIDTAPLNPVRLYMPEGVDHQLYWGWIPEDGRVFTYWFERQPRSNVVRSNTKTYRHVWLLDARDVEGVANQGMPGADIDAVGIRSHQVDPGLSGLAAWYPFDDDGETAEDYTHRLDSRYAIEGVAGFDAVVYSDLVGQIDDDQDAIPDWWEQVLFSMPATGTNDLSTAVLGDADPEADLDGDGLNNLYEYYCQTSPTDPDTDNDGVTDGNADFDGDGLENHEEQVQGTDPRLTDTDDDGYSDSEEYVARTDPTVSVDPLVLRALELKGAGDYLEMPFDTRFALTNWTVEAWICPVTGWAGGGNIIQRLVDGTVANYTLGVNTSGKVVAGFGDCMVTSTVSVAANSTTWTHVMASFDAASNELRLFVNDQPEGERICATSPRSSGVGLTRQTVGEGFRGWIDEVRVWDRAMDTMMVTLTGGEEGLVAYYRFDDGTSFEPGLVGTSGCGKWQRGQVEDFVGLYSQDWRYKWFDAATLHGNARMISNNLNWQPVLSDDTDNDGMPDAWESTYSDALLLLVDDSREDYDGDGWDNYTEMLWGLVEGGCTFGRSTDPTNPTNYPTPEVTFTFRYDSTKGLVATGAVIHAEVFSTYTMNGEPDASIDIPVEGADWGDAPFSYTVNTISVDTNGIVTGIAPFDVGHLRQGQAWVYAFLDANGNGSWDAGEPAGTGQYQSSVKTAPYGVNVDVGPVEFVVGLSDEVYGYPRFAWPDTGAAFTKVTIKNLSVTGSPIILQTNIYNRSYFHEGDLAAALGAGSLGRNTYQWLYGNTPGGTTTYDWPTTVNTPLLEWPADGSFLTKARNEFRWSMQTNVTQYTLTIRNEATLATVLQKTYDVKYANASGRYRFELPIYAGDDGFEDGNYSWTLEAKQPRPATKISARRYFTVDLRTTPLGPYSISGTVVAESGASVTGGTYVVQAFQDGFSGPAEAEQHMSAKGLLMFKLEGLAAGSYYVRAFLDQDADNTLDAWESFGYVLDPACTLARPLGMAVPGDAVGKVVWVSHVDTDHDSLPDAWEYQYFGANFNNLTLPYGREGDPDADGLSNFEEHNVGTNPLRADTDGDGLSDYAEVSVYGSSPILSDTDGDGMSDSAEVTRGTSSTHVDSDADGIPDGTEVALGLDPLLADDDNDGIDSLNEMNWDGASGYAPYKPALGTGTDLNALKADTDEDGVNDLEEIAAGSDPLNAADEQNLIITGITVDGDGRPVVSWPIWANMGSLPLTFRLESSPDLVTWTVISTVAIEGTTDGMALVPDAVSSGPVYYRLKVGLVRVAADCGGACP
jgi:hypothetical protein